VMPSANSQLFFGSSAIANVLSSVNWNTETSRLLTSGGIVSSAVWAETSRLLTSAAVVWGYTTRNLTSFGVTLGADVWAVTTKAVTAIPAGYSTMIASDVWTQTSRTLTSWGGISTAAGAGSTVTIPDIWAYSTRTLTAGASTFTASDVWSVASRTLTSWGGQSTFTASDVWSVAARTLTSAGVVWTETTRTVTGIPVSTWGASDVWNEVLTSATHDVAGSAGRRLRSQGDVLAGAVNDPAPTAASFITNLPSAVNNFYADRVLRFRTGAQAGENRVIYSYIGATKTVYFDEPLTAAPSTADAFELVDAHVHPITQMAVQNWINSDRTLTSANVIWAETSRLLTSYAALMNTPVDGTLTFWQKQRLETGVMLSESTGGGTGAIAFRNWGSTKDRISYTVSTVGNRSVTTYDLT
jgi:hypothetical protein